MTRIEILPPVRPPEDVDAELDRLAARYRAAAGPGIRVLNLVGGQAESLLDRLPAQVRAGLGGATADALKLALRAAEASRSAVPTTRPWMSRAVTTSLGAVGGAGGLPTALAELPLTTTLLLREIQQAAVDHGFDPREESVRFDCLSVFGEAGPLDKDDGAETGFLSLRLALTGGALHRVIAAVAPRLGVSLGQKLAAQSVPVLGMVAGATVNYTYTRYYGEVAHVHFGLRRLAIDADQPFDQITRKLIEKMENPLR
jgi:hypothetical protein